MKSVSSASRTATGFCTSRDDGRAPACGKAQVAQEVRLAAVEHEVDRDRSTRSTVSNVAPVCAAGDQVAGIDAPVGNAPGDRRAHLGPFEIELGLLRARLRAEATWPAASRWVDLRVSNSRSVKVWLRTSGVARSTSSGGDLELGPRAFHIGFGLLDRELVGARIDDEQEVALLDDLAVLEMDGIDEAGDPGADLDRLHRREAAGVFVPLGDRLLQRLATP